MSNEVQKEFTEALGCGHCGNKTPMEVVAKHSQVTSRDHMASQTTWDEGPVFQLARCPACSGVTLRRFFYHDAMDQEDEEWEILFPRPSATPRGLPAPIHKALQAAEKVRPIDANAYAVLLRRVLDLVCHDRGATGGSLNQKLEDLAARDEIPQKLVAVAKGLRRLSNVGAHAELGELTSAEVPILEALSRAVLEYVYSAPFLATQAEERLAKLKTPGSSEEADA